MPTFKNLEEIWKTWKKFGKNEWQPCYMDHLKVFPFLSTLIDFFN